jgi:ParB family transcriptional regulator, chromosome partitioning protein
MKLADIEPNPKQPRKDFDQDKLQELADNIKQVGLKQPLIVRPLKDGKKYQLVDGERRYRACKLIPLEDVPVEVREDIKTEEDAALQSYIINDQRQNYSPQDKEAYIYHLKEVTKLSTRKLAAKLGVHHSAIDHYLEAYRFRQKLPAYLVGTLPLTFSMLKQTAGIKDDNLRITMLQALHDKRIKADAYEIALVANTLWKLPREAWEAYFRKLMTLEELEEYLIKNPKYMHDYEKKFEESGLDKKLKEGKITEEEYYAHPLNNQIPVLVPTEKSSELLTKEEKEHIVSAADLIKEDRTGIVYIQNPDTLKIHKFTWDIEKERQANWYQIKKNREEMTEKHGLLKVEAMVEWGMACEDGVIQATEDIEDLDLRMRTIELVIDYRFAKWVDKAFKANNDAEDEEDTIMDLKTEQMNKK